MPAPFLVRVPVLVPMMPEIVVLPVELTVRLLAPEMPPEMVKFEPESVAIVVAWPSVMFPAQELLPEMLRRAAPV